MKNIKIFATFFICLLVLSACSDDWKGNALTAKFAFDKTIYYVGEEVSITGESPSAEVHKSNSQSCSPVVAENLRK